MVLIEDKLNDKNLKHLFLQYFFQKECVSDNKLNRLISAYKKHQNDESINKDTMIINANKTLRNYGFQIKSMLDEASKEMFHILVSDIDDDTLSGQRSWSNNENGLYHLLIDFIVESFMQNKNEEISLDEQLSIEESEISNVIRKAQANNIKLTIAQSEKIIENWIYGHRFTKIGGRKITLGIRTLADKSSYLCQKYGFTECCLCNTVCFYGHKCLTCDTIIHAHCTQSITKCNKCKQDLLINQKNIVSLDVDNSSDNQEYQSD